MVGERTRVFFFIGTLGLGGAERQVVELATRLDQTRFEPRICCWRKVGPLVQHAEAAGVPVIGLVSQPPDHERPFRTAATIALRLYPEIRSFRPHLVHGNLWASCVIGTVVARIARVPVVVTSRRSLATAKLPGVVTPRVWHGLIDRFINRLTDLVIANSEEVRQDAIRYEGIAPQKIITILNGVDKERFRVDGQLERLREELGLNSGPIVGCVANIMPRKGHDHLLAAAPAVVQTFPSVVFLLVGDGPLREKYQSEVEQQKLETNVVFVGSRPDVPKILSLIDIAVLASDSEGSPNAVIEAMMAGKPVVATRVGGASEAVSPGETGVLVPPEDPKALADALITMLSAPERWPRMGDAGQKRARELFSIDRMVCATSAIYEQLVAPQSRHVLQQRGWSAGSLLRRRQIPRAAGGTRQSRWDLG